MGKQKLIVQEFLIPSQNLLTPSRQIPTPSHLGSQIFSPCVTKKLLGYVYKRSVTFGFALDMNPGLLGDIDVCVVQHSTPTSTSLGTFTNYVALCNCSDCLKLRGMWSAWR